MVRLEGIIFPSRSHLRNICVETPKIFAASPTAITCSFQYSMRRLKQVQGKLLKAPRLGIKNGLVEIF